MIAEALGARLLVVLPQIMELARLKHTVVVIGECQIANALIERLGRIESQN